MRNVLKSGCSYGHCLICGAAGEGLGFFVIKHLEFLLSVGVALMWLSFCNSHHGSLSFHNQHGRDSRGRKDITISYSITHTSCHSSDTLPVK